jgi:hypothetical protein
MLADAAHCEGSDNGLWITATSKWSSINRRFQLNVSAAQLELDLHDLWFLYCEAAKNTAYNHPAMDRLAFQVVQAQAQGTLSRHCTTSEGKRTDREHAFTRDGKIWADLPFFVHDMTSFWIADCASMQPTNRLNLATFLAKLASVGVLDDRLCGIALITLRQALETERPLGTLGIISSDEPEIRVKGSMQELTIAELLPAANAWLLVCARKIMDLSHQQWNNCPSDDGYPGPLYLQHVSGDEQNATLSGFSAERWSFWMRRLQEVVREATAEGNDSLAHFASRVTDNMVLMLDEASSDTRELLEASADMSQHQVHNQELGPGLPPPAEF